MYLNGIDKKFPLKTVMQYCYSYSAHQNLKDFHSVLIDMCTFIGIVVSEDVVVAQDNSTASCQFGRLRDLRPIHIGGPALGGDDGHNPCNNNQWIN